MIQCLIIMQPIPFPTIHTANWDGIEDRESGLLAYTWCISSSTEYSCDILEQENPHGSITEQAYWTNTGLARFSDDPLNDGPYYVTVDAINNAGYGGALVTTIHHTTPFILDTTPPVIDGLTVVEYDIVKNILSVDFSVRLVVLSYNYCIRLLIIIT